MENEFQYRSTKTGSNNQLSSEIEWIRTFCLLVFNNANMIQSESQSSSESY